MTINTTNPNLEAENQVNKKSSKKKYLIAGAAALTTLLGGTGAYFLNSKGEKAPEKEKIETLAPEKKTQEKSENTITFQEAKEQISNEKAEKAEDQEKVIDDGRDLSDLPEETEREKEGLSEESWRENQRIKEEGMKVIREAAEIYEKGVLTEEIIKATNKEAFFCEHFESYLKGLKEYKMGKSKHPNIKKMEEFYKKLKAEGY